MQSNSSSSQRDLSEASRVLQADATDQEKVSSARHRISAHFARLGWAAPWLIALSVTLAVLPLPRQPFHLDDSLAYEAVLSYAHQHGLQFGKSIVFTYGPLGFLANRHFFPQDLGWHLSGNFFLGFIVSLAVCFTAWRLKLVWRCLLVGAFVFLSANIDPRIDLLVYAGLLCWGCLCFVESGRRLLFCAVGYGVLTAVVALIKMNFLFVGALGAVMIAAYLWLCGSLRAAMFLLLSVMIAFIIGWLISGQHLFHLAGFFSSALQILHGYSDVVGLQGLRSLTARGGLTLFLTSAALILTGVGVWTARPDAAFQAGVGWPRGVPTPASLRLCLLFLWLFALLFAVWKHGFVRADLYHMGFWFGFVPLLVIMLELITSKGSRTRTWARGFGLASCVLGVSTVATFFVANLPSALAEPFRSFVFNVSALVRPANLRQQMLSQYETARLASQLPKLQAIIGHDSVDVFGQDQFYALFNGLKYSPRPVFQSYLAYNAALMRLNEGFYLSARAPEYVLFKLDPVDRKFPTLEDALVLRFLVHNYSVASAEGAFLLLKRDTSQPAALSLLNEGFVNLGQVIDLREYNQGELWMELDVRPTWRGQLERLLFKAPKLRLAVWDRALQKRLTRGGAPVPMLAAGFLVSPVLRRTDDAQDLFAGNPGLRPGGCSLEPQPGTESSWQPQVRFRIYAVQYQSSAQRP